MEEPVRISIIAGDGKKHVVEVDASVWLKNLGLDAVEIVMLEEVGYEFIEDTALMLPYRDRKSCSGFTIRNFLMQPPHHPGFLVIIAPTS